MKAVDVLDTLVVVAFFAVIVLVLTKTIPESGKEIALMLLGALTGEFVGVGKYRHGGTASSERKDQTIADQGKMLAAAVPAPAGETSTIAVTTTDAPPGPPTTTTTHSTTTAVPVTPTQGPTP